MVEVLRAPFVEVPRKEALQRLKLYFIASPARREAFKDDVGWWFRSLQDDPEFKRLIGS